ncbi:hypothetical protein F2P81_005164 [Scophthalmus maximus]|uniref:Uncharacterized protein n=1 Tax=Scophthalmus maximus TaxID=52904 RepID=A0A6A4THR2_SCOMX|nr:hypothetical protein F2P81_005164 [Scophthalmus maximus]
MQQQRVHKPAGAGAGAGSSREHKVDLVRIQISPAVVESIPVPARPEKKKKKKKKEKKEASPRLRLSVVSSGATTLCSELGCESGLFCCDCCCSLSAAKRKRPNICERETPTVLQRRSRGAAARPRYDGTRLLRLFDSFIFALRVLFYFLRLNSTLCVFVGGTIAASNPRFDCKRLW